MNKKSQKCYISRVCGYGTFGAISIKFGPLVHMVIVINSAKFDHCNFIGLDLARVKIFHFPMLNLTAHATGLACDKIRVKKGNSGTLSNFVDCKVILQQISSVFSALH
jgi:hypothetical protein